MAYTNMMEFVETPVFTREIKKLLPDDEYRQLQIALLLRPDAGALIPGGGGLRKLRWRLPGEGKRGGLRLIYYWAIPETIYMLFPFKKSSQDDLTPSQLKELRRLVKEVLK
jgi:hypothetical protein